MAHVLIVFFLMASASVNASRQVKYSVREHTPYDLAAAQVEQLLADLLQYVKLW